MCLSKKIFMPILKIFSFCIDKVVFLGFDMKSKDVEENESKIDTIKNWPTSKSIINIRSFDKLANFYRLFVKEFSTIVALLKEVIQRISLCERV